DARQRRGHGALPAGAGPRGRRLHHRIRRRRHRGGHAAGRRRRCRVKRFSQLFRELDETTSTNAKVEALTRYFDLAPARDAAWAVYFLAGGKPRQVMNMNLLAALACEAARIEPWLFDECYQQVGDLAETISLVLPA